MGISNIDNISYAKENRTKTSEIGAVKKYIMAPNQYKFK